MNSRKLTQSPGSNPAPATQAQIAALAHELWRERGCPEGSDLDIWLEAERQLNGAPARHRSVRDDIPADMGSTDVDTDPAINPRRDRELPHPRDPGDRSATTFGL